MKIDIKATIRGRCDLCRFVGQLLRKPVMQPTDLNTVTGDMAESLPVLNVCLTCFATPAGILSDNQTHQRLPKAEYLKK